MDIQAIGVLGLAGLFSILALIFSQSEQTLLTATFFALALASVFGFLRFKKEATSEQRDKTTRH